MNIGIERYKGYSERDMDMWVESNEECRDRHMK
jgi:hypothetical protein